MAISVFDMFKIGIGPSSSHTMGPMKAAVYFLRELQSAGLVNKTDSVVVELFGSLALTGVGHGTDKAVLLGLEGSLPDAIDPDTIEPRLEKILGAKEIRLNGERTIAFDPQKHLIFHRRKALPYHPNGMRFAAFDKTAKELASGTYYSIGGGFVVDEKTAAKDRLNKDTVNVACPFKTAKDLLDICVEKKLSIAEVMLANEKSWRSEEETLAGLDKIWAAMGACIHRGLQIEGVLPGKLKVKRRAARVFKELNKDPDGAKRDPLVIIDWVNLFALAVNEENASGARVVTAPTNGAAGIIPAVIKYYEKFCDGANRQGIHNFLLTSAAIGVLYTENASISGAEVGCQGEVGVACSMAAGGLVAALGGSMAQVEQAAEIGMEHNLGLTCDPIGGLVQIPCIERNAMGAVKAINAARIALRGDGSHYVSLDSVIRTMRQTGADMKDKYKETSRGGLAVNVTEC